CPFLTSSPSLKPTSTIWPSTRAFTDTVEYASTLPIAWMRNGTSCWRTGSTVTGTAGGPFGALRSFARISAPKYKNSTIATASVPTPPRTIQRLDVLCPARRGRAGISMASLTMALRRVFHLALRCRPAFGHAAESSVHRPFLHAEHERLPYAAVTLPRFLRLTGNAQIYGKRRSDAKRLATLSRSRTTRDVPPSTITSAGRGLEL